jgi:hypothetical protein
MAICTYGAKERYTEEQIVKDAVENGIVDEEGNVFEIITLVSLRPVAGHSSTHGFQDTFIDVRGGGTRIWQGEKGRGRIKWLRHRSGQMLGQLAKTPHNVGILAANYFFKSWKIRDPIQEVEIRALAEKRRSNMTQKEIDFEKSLIEGSVKSSYGGEALTTGGKTIAQAEKEIESASLAQKQRELSRKEEELKNKEVKISKIVEKRIEEGAKITLHTREELANVKMSLFILRKILRSEFGIEPAKTDVKSKLVDWILLEQEKRQQKTETKPMVVTG